MTPRPSRAGEERALMALWKEVFGDSDEYIDTFFREVYRPGMASVIEENGEIAAAAYAVPFGKYRYIYAVATKPEYRGRGYGKAAMQRVLSYIASKPFGNSNHVSLTCEPDNKAAYGLYKRLGFNESGRSDEDEVELELYLK